MKLCYNCKQEKPEEDYHKASSRKDGLQGECKTCRSSRHRKTYAYNNERADAIRRTSSERRKEFQRRVNELKAGRSCTDCGGIFPSYVMDYDHLPGFTKIASVSNMVVYGISWKKIEAEITKCELVCANCHRIRTHERAA